MINNTIDDIFIALLVLSCILGIWRGLVQEAMSLAGWFLALFAAYGLADYLAPYLAMTGFSETTRYGLAFILIFIAALFAWGIITVLIKKIIGAVGLRPIDRALGGIFGLVRGIVILISVTLFMSQTPIDHTEVWQNSFAIQTCKAAAHALKPFLSPSVSAFIS
jgi:membrane protein required for colicin V production